MVRFTAQVLSPAENRRRKALYGYGVNDKVTYRGKTGTVAFVGPTFFATGPWIGLCLEEPDGKNNGSKNNTTYFVCPDNHGLFVRTGSEWLNQGWQLGQLEPFLEMPADPPNSAIEELLRIFQCSICFEHRPTAVFCQGCRHPATCLLCRHNVEESGNNRCPKCRHDWSSEGSTFTTNAFSSILHLVSHSSTPSVTLPLLPTGNEPHQTDQPEDELSTARSISLTSASTAGSTSSISTRHSSSSSSEDDAPEAQAVEETI